MTDVVGWWAYVVRYEARETWRAMPGPWPVKVALIVALTAIPGQVDELVFLAVLGWVRRRKAHTG